MKRKIKKYIFEGDNPKLVQGSNVYVSSAEIELLTRTQMCLNEREKLEELYVLGDIVASDLDSIAMVGSRKITNYGKDLCDYFGGRMAAAGVTIVSGLMYGVDAYSHWAALNAGGRTIAVLGYGINHIDQISQYAQKIFQKIINDQSGVIISEYPPDSHPQKWTFSQRNRIISAISKATLVVEASKKSGSLITASFAQEQNKDVFIIPGSIFADVSKGKHMLLKAGGIPVDDPRDILEYLKIVPISNDEIGLRFPKNLGENELKVYKTIMREPDPISPDKILERLNWNLNISEVNISLTWLEMEKLIVRNILGRWRPKGRKS